MKHRFGVALSISVAVLFVLTGVLAVVDNSGAKPTTASGDVAFRNENGMPVNSYTLGETMYIHLSGTAGSGSSPRFIYRLYADSNTQWDVDAWYTSSLNEIVTFELFSIAPSGQWKAVLSYIDSKLHNEMKLAFDTVQVIGNEAPVAIIDSISPNPVDEGVTVTFTGHGYDPDGYIVAHRWTSSLDGLIGSGSTVTSSSLSAGTHKIWYTVTDNVGLEGGDYEWLEVIEGIPPSYAYIDYMRGVSPVEAEGRAAQGGLAEFDGDAYDGYGNQIGDDDGADLTTEIGGGSIVIHKAK